MIYLNFETIEKRKYQNVKVHKEIDLLDVISDKGKKSELNRNCEYELVSMIVTKNGRTTVITQREGGKWRAVEDTCNEKRTSLLST